MQPEERTLWSVQQSKPSVLPVVIRWQFLASVGISFLISSFIEHKQNRTSTTPFLKTSGSFYLHLLDVYPFGAMLCRPYQVCIDSVKKYYLKIVKSRPSLRLADHSFWRSELNTFWISDWVCKECNAFLKNLNFHPEKKKLSILKCALVLIQKKKKIKSISELEKKTNTKTPQPTKPQTPAVLVPEYFLVMQLLHNNIFPCYIIDT